MSFSKDVKEELSKVLPNSRHCQLSELSALMKFSSDLRQTNSLQGNKIFTLQKKTCMIEKYVDASLKRSCCVRAYLRGAFLCIGSVNDPQKSYNLEFVCNNEQDASLLRECISKFDIESKTAQRKNDFIVYIKEAESIVNMLNVLGAHNSLMYLETLRVEKDVRNSINRKVNCETANIAKTVNASAKQTEDIKKISDTVGLDSLPGPLREMALVRLQYPDSPLSELGQYLDPPVGKSGVNHRIRKLSEIADKIG